MNCRSQFCVQGEIPLQVFLGGLLGVKAGGVARAPLRRGPHRDQIALGFPDPAANQVRLFFSYRILPSRSAVVTNA